MAVIAYIGLGSNVGDREGQVRKAVELLAPSVVVKRVSSFFRTEPVGSREQDDFLNAVVQIETGLTPEDLLARCQAVEDSLGRVRKLRWGPRTIDLDILLYGDEVLDRAGLTIPHPRMAERKFVLVPLAEIAPDVVHPVLQRTVRQLLEASKDRHTVLRWRPDDTRP